jgi:hypothetical protein
VEVDRELTENCLLVQQKFNVEFDVFESISCVGCWVLGEMFLVGWLVDDVVKWTG